jgi:hypothetical protein
MRCVIGSSCHTQGLCVPRVLLLCFATGMQDSPSVVLRSGHCTPVKCTHPSSTARLSFLVSIIQRQGRAGRLLQREGWGPQRGLGWVLAHMCVRLCLG